MVVVLMGVSGSGKTTIGKALAAELGWVFVEADDFHPTANVEKMRGGVALNDDDRRPWLRLLQGRIEEACERNENLVVACSALRNDYRDYLEKHDPNCVHFVYLHGSKELIRRRLEEREGHYMDPALLQSQFEALEPPADAIHQVDITPTPEAIAIEIRQQLEV